MASAGSSGQRAASAARQAADSKWIERTARVGLAARGLVYVLIAVLAFQIALVDRAERADQQGAFQTLAQNGFGKAILWLDAPMWRQALAGSRAVGRADGRRSGPGSVGSRGGSCPERGGGRRTCGLLGRCGAWSGPRCTGPG